MSPPTNAAMEEQSIELIKNLAADPKNQSVMSTWYCIASISFAACNQGPSVVHVYNAAVAQHPNDAEARRLVLRRIKEALLKAAPIISMPRLLNAFFPLVKAIPDEEPWDDLVVRKHVKNPFDLTERGAQYMKDVFGKGDMEAFIATMAKFWPDLHSLVVSQIYGLYQAELSVLNRIETSQMSIAGLLPMDCPTEVSWHWRGLINNGGTLEQIHYATDIAKNICKVTAVELKKPLYVIDEVIRDHELLSKHVL